MRHPPDMNYLLDRIYALKAAVDDLQRLGVELTHLDPLLKGVQSQDQPMIRPTGPSIHDVFAHWADRHRQAQGAPTTVRDWNRVAVAFSAFRGTNDLSTVTSEDIRRFRAHLLERGLSAKTVRATYVAALKALFSHAVTHGFLAQNPAHDLRVKRNRFENQSHMGAFSDREAAVILQSAAQQTDPLLKWVPWLTAYTGSRISTIVNLRGKDVYTRDGITLLRITREAGPVKTAESEREVPVHAAILAMGFAEFVAARGAGRLFYDDEPAVSSEIGRYNRGRIPVKRLTRWVHSLGLNLGREVGRAPNHAWRHWFREKAVELGVLEKITDAIVGHAPPNAARAYGSVTLATMKEQIDRFPVP